MVSAHSSFDGFYQRTPEYFSMRETPVTTGYSRYLKPGIYRPDTDNHGCPIYGIHEVTGDKIVAGGSSRFSHIQNLVEQFFSTEVEKDYADWGLTHRMGILLYGQPGCGKTTIIRSVMDYFVNQLGGVVFYNPPYYKIARYIEMFRRQSDQKVLVVFEDFEEIGDEEETLQFLDGADSHPGVLTLATTNYRDNLPERLLRRPSRFAHVLEVKAPEADIRQHYIMNMLPAHWDKARRDHVAMNMPLWLNITEGFTLDEVKHFVIGVMIMKQSPEHVAARISGKEVPSTDDASKSGSVEMPEGTSGDSPTQQLWKIEEMCPDLVQQNPSQELSLDGVVDALLAGAD